MQYNPGPENRMARCMLASENNLCSPALLCNKFKIDLSRKGFCRNPRGIFPNKVPGEFWGGVFGGFFRAFFPGK